jgi:hypothetical protein
MKKNIRQNIQIASSIEDINKKAPALKETEIPKYAFHVMADDFRKGIISGDVWDEIVKRDYGDKKRNIDFSEVRSCTIEDEDFDCVVVGKNDPSNNWAYMKREGVSRAPLGHVTKLVLYYVRGKLLEEDSNQLAISGVGRNPTFLDERFELLSKIIKIMEQKDKKSDEKLERIREIVEED